MVAVRARMVAGDDAVAARGSQRRRVPHRASSRRASSSARAQGEQFDPREFESADNKRAVLDSLIDQQVLQMSAGRAGVAIGDAQVRDAIQAIPAFQVDGKFDPQRYQLALAFADSAADAASSSSSAFATTCSKR